MDEIRGSDLEVEGMAPVNRGFELVDIWYRRVSGMNDDLGGKEGALPDRERAWLTVRSTAPKGLLLKGGYDARRLDRVLEFMSKTALRGAALRKALDDMEFGTEKENSDPARLVDTVMREIAIEAVPLCLQGLSKPKRLVMSQFVSRRRRLKHRALRTLAYEVHGGRVTAEALPKTQDWIYIWKELDGQPGVWLERLYAAVESKAAR